MKRAEYEPAHILVEYNGVGIGLIQQLEEQGIEVTAARSRTIRSFAPAWRPSLSRPDVFFCRHGSTGPSLHFLKSYSRFRTAKTTTRSTP